MTEPNAEQAPGNPRVWQPRFDLRSLLLAMVVFSVMGAAGYYFMQAREGDPVSTLAFILFTLTAPVLLVVLLSLFKSAMKWLGNRR